MMMLKDGTQWMILEVSKQITKMLIQKDQIMVATYKVKLDKELMSPNMNKY